MQLTTNVQNTNNLTVVNCCILECSIIDKQVNSNYWIQTSSLKKHWWSVYTIWRQSSFIPRPFPLEESRGLSVHKVVPMPFVVHDTRDGSKQNGNYYIWVPTTPCVSTFCLPDVTLHDQISQVFLLWICILQAIKDWRWNGLGTRLEAELHHCTLSDFIW